MAERKNVDVPEAPEKEGFLDFIYNKREKTVLGRTGGSWAKIGLFYAIFYACLAGWFTGLLHVFYSTLPESEPKWSGNDSLTLNNPGMGYRPMPIFDQTLIWFTQGVRSSAEPYIDHLGAFVDTFNTTAEECPGDMKVTNTTSCRFNVKAYLQEVGCADDSFGYVDGKFCVALKMNKLFGYVADVYTSMDNITQHLRDMEKEDELEERAYDYQVEHLAFSTEKPAVGVSCFGANAVDRSNIRNITFAPEGFEKRFFPYNNQPEYRAPVVFARFDVVERVLIQVICKLWANDIDNYGTQWRVGSVNFEILKD